MASDDVWILGIHMTKFGKHPDKDTVDLAAEATMGALADGGVTMKDIGVLAAGNLMGGAGGIGQPLQKQIGQTGIPVYNVANACATGATALRTAIMAVKAGESDIGLAVGVEKLAGAGLLAGGARGAGLRHLDAEGSLRRGRAGRRPDRHRDHAGRVRPDRHGVRPQVRRCRLRAVRPDQREEPRALDAEPAGGYQKRFTLDEIMNDVMIAYPNTRPMCSANCDGAAAAVVVSDAKLKTLSLEQRRRAVKVSASILTTDPWEEACQILPNVNTLTRNAAQQAYEQAGVGPEDLDLVELHDCFATAELVHYDNLMLCEPGRRRRLLPIRAQPGATARPRSTSPAASSRRATRSRPPASPTSGRSATTCAARPATARSRAPVGLAHVIGLGSACGVHILERSAA